MKAVYTLSDLAELDPENLEQPIRLAVIGKPIAHSASPLMHQAALDAHGITARYIRLELAENELKPAFALMREKGFIGCNITVPHKFEALESCDIVSPEAQLLGAVNTVRFDPDTIRGFNTDGPGFIAAIKKLMPNHAIDSLHILILGAGGGAGQAIAIQCALSRVMRLTLVNRSLEKLHSVQQKLLRINPEIELQVLNFEDEQFRSTCKNADLIVNATSNGLKADDNLLLHADCLRGSDQTVYDTIYNPPQTALLRLAATQSCRIENGLSMLTQQGALAFQLWFPGTDPLPHMEAALQAK